VSSLGLSELVLIVKTSLRRHGSTPLRAFVARPKVYGPVELEWMNAESYYFYDPDGNLLEFWSPRS
jgi:catechol 2,3-dioxygenase-like lactoylglutathione lyase family enzyme